MTLPLACRAVNLVGSEIDSSTKLIAQQPHDVIRFGMGAPSEDLIPISDLDHSFSRKSPGRYDYGESAGEPELIAEVVKLSTKRGVSTSDDRIVITNGAMQGLDLAFKLFVDPGDLVVVESPTYTNASATARSYEADVLLAPTDENGLVVEALEEIVKSERRPPKIIYVIPNFQNPTGNTLSLERRVRLIELAEKWGSVVVEDDPYGMLRFDGKKVPSFLELSPSNPLIFSVQTFSKIIAPGLRVGWIDVDPRVSELAINAKQAVDTCTNVPNQRAVADFLKADKLAPHIDRLLPIYSARKAAMVSAVEEFFGASLVHTDPQGGFFLWASFRNEFARISTEELFPRALAGGVAFVPGNAFAPGPGPESSLRLCFATSSPERIYEGIARLSKAARQMVNG